MIGSGKRENNTYYTSIFSNRIDKILRLNIANKGREKLKDETDIFA